MGKTLGRPKTLDREEIINIASNTSNVGLTNKYTFKSTKKNSNCGDLIEVELILKNSKINSMKYETESCVLCEASASLLSKKIKNLPIKTIKKELNKLISLWNICKTMYEPQTTERINAVQRINKPIRLFKTINFITKYYRQCDAFIKN